METIEDNTTLLHTFNPDEEPHYRNMEVSDWKNQPHEETAYSRYWEDNTEFRPDSFAANMTSSDQPVDFGYTVLFLINLLVIGILAVVVLVSTGGTQKETQTEDIPANFMPPILDGIITAAFVTALHFWFAATFPYLYIKWGMLLSVAAMILVATSLVATTGILSPYVFYAIFLYTGAAVVGYFILWSRLPFTTAVFTKGVQVIRDYPALVLVIAFQMFVEITCGLLYGYVAFGLSQLGVSPLVHLYCMFSYFWVSYTVNYVCYMAGAGVAACDYFLKGTDEFPRTPVWSSFKRAVLRSFGSAAKAGLVIALITTVRQALNMARRARTERHNNETGAGDVVLAILECVAMCILHVLESVALFLNRYGLIYCSVYGVPYTEGCRRWMELKYTRFIDVLFSSSVVDTALVYNMLAFMIVSGVAGAVLGKLQTGKGSGYTLVVIVTAVVMSMVFFCLVEKPFMVSVDTYLIAFAEDPERLWHTDPQLYGQFESAYRRALLERVSAFGDEP